MNWFIAKIVYQIICGDGNHCPQFDEQLRLVFANDFPDAFEKATDIGNLEATCFANDKNQLVQWKFIAVPELIPVQEFKHGAEIYSRIREVDNPQHYKEIIYRRSENLVQNQLQCQSFHFLT
jgi:Domain of unknown function (DUF4288)